VKKILLCHVVMGAGFVICALASCVLGVGRAAAQSTLLPPATWQELAELTASDGPQTFTSIAIDGNTVVVGAPYGTAETNYEGAAYVFVKPTDGWSSMTQVAKLTASDGNTENYFGGAVAISGGTIVVGASRATRFPNHNRGAAYVFIEPDAGWADMTETAELKYPHDYPNSGYFGTGVATDGTTVAVGWTNYLFRSAVYMFAKPASGWKTGLMYQAELTPPAGTFGLYDGFGSYLALSGGTLVVGAPSPFIYPMSGAAYIFVEPPGGWVSMSQTATLTASNAGSRAYFGASVAIQGDTIAVGAPQVRYSYGPGPGGAYVFVEPPGGWADMTETAELRASDGQKGDQLGASVALNGSGETLWVGAPGHNSGQGAAYVYVKPTNGWATTSKFNTEIPSPGGSSFGASLSIFGDVEAITGDTAAYIFGPE
jgi:hypothetical protein